MDWVDYEASVEEAAMAICKGHRFELGLPVTGDLTDLECEQQICKMGCPLDQTTEMSDKQYRYKVLPRSLVLATFLVTTLPDAFVSEDVQQHLVLQALAEGYRWVRSEGEYAVFEREITDGKR